MVARIGSALSSVTPFSENFVNLEVLSLGQGAREMSYQFAHSLINIVKDIIQEER